MRFTTPAGAKEARQWNANALLRLMIDNDFIASSGETSGGFADFLSFYRMGLQSDPALAAFLDSDGRAQAAAIERAIAWEQATPRRYLLTEHFPLDGARTGDGFVAALPAEGKRIFAEAEARQIAAAHEGASRRSAMADLVDDAEAAVGGGRAAREAIEAIAEADRTLLVARRSVKIDCPSEIRFAQGAAVSGDAAQAAILCAQPEGPANTLRIVDLMNGRTLRRAAVSGFDLETVGAFSDGVAVTLVAKRDYAKPSDPHGLRPSNVAPLYALSAGSSLRPMRFQVPAEVGAGHEAGARGFLISPSGRFAAVSFTREITGAADPAHEIAAVYELPQLALRWQAVRPFAPPSEGHPQSEQVLAAFIDESGPALVNLVSAARNNRLAAIALERVDLSSGAVRRTELPAGIENVAPTPYGSGRALMYFSQATADEATREYALIDLDAMRVAWRGRWADRPVQAIAQPRCEKWAYAGAQGEVERWTLVAPALPRAIALDPLRGDPWSACAVSADGRHLALIVPPYAHIYDIAPQQR